MIRRALKLAVGVLVLALATSEAPADTPPETPSAKLPEAAQPAQPTNAISTNGGLDCILPSDESHGKALEAYWDNGFQLRSADKQFRLHVGGNAQVATTWLIGPNGAFIDANGSPSGVDNSQAIFLRRVRFRMDGQIWSIFDYAVEYDLANASNENDGLQPPSFNNLTSAPVPCNIWMQVRDVPWFGNVRIGNQVKPIGMTNNTTQTMLPFIERADNMDAFYGPFDNGFSLGITSRNIAESERATWQYGVYQPAINSFGVALNKWAAGGRVTGLPIYDEDGCRLVHAGLGVWMSDLPENSVRARARTVLRNGPGFVVPIMVDTGNIDAGSQYIFAPELAAVYGPWTFQAEYAGQFVHDAIVGNQNPATYYFHGGYAEILYFLTGEHQDYDKQEGVFGRVVPRNNLKITRCGGCETCGAWQLGARFSYADLTDKAIDGGQIYDLTLGVNWFLNPNMKIQLNYILERRDAPQNVTQDWINGIGLMAGVDF